MFDQDYLDFTTYSPWYGIPIVYLPIVCYSIYRAYLEGISIFDGIFTFALGIIYWTLNEYLIHRFVFHGEDYWLPNINKVMAIHWCFHGVHHTFPQEKYRVVFPVLPGLLTMYFLFGSPIFYVLPELYAWAFYAGAILSYTIYDSTHYLWHHSSPSWSYLRSLKAHHMSHHYRTGAVKYGVSCKFWDIVFRTED